MAIFRRANPIAKPQARFKTRKGKGRRQTRHRKPSKTFWRQHPNQSIQARSKGLNFSSESNIG